MKARKFILLSIGMGVAVFLAAAVGVTAVPRAAASQNVLSWLHQRTTLGPVTDWDLPSETVHGTGALPAMDDQTQQFYEQSAKDLGVPVESLMTKWTGDSFNELVSTYRSKYPDNYVAAGRTEPDSKTGSDYDLVFVNRPPNEVFQELSALPVSVDVRYGAPMSEDQQRAASLLVIRFIQAVAPGAVVDASFSPLGTSARILYGTPDGRPSPDVSADILRAQLGEAFGQTLPDVEVAYASALHQDEYVDMKGGYGYSGCTSGFAAKNSGNPGLLTAKHCSDYPYYAGTGIQMGNLINASPDIDIQWNRTPSPHTAVPMFRNDAGHENTVTNVVNPVLGDLVAKYGVTTGRTVGYVTDADWCDTAGYCHLFKVNLAADHGDSGGPCFTSGTARGLMRGGTTNLSWCTQIESSPTTVMQQ